ncbi:hypothetical protein WG219_10655 [Ectopseudomonas mendocina]|uniref:ABC transporter substrate-binding protein n=1 Tax=Ectopseudomonas mendocina TaxID=300 RepID=A0ABZ2RUA5_ECTME
MRKAFAPVPRLFLLSGLSVAIAGCAGNPLQPSVNTSEPSSLHGELTTQSKVNVNNGSRYQSYGLRLQEGEAVRIEQSEPLATQLTLLDSQGRLVAGPGADNLTLVSSQTGSYTLSVSGSSSTDYGPFALALQPIEARSSGELGAGDSFAGSLKSGGNAYQLKITEAAIYTIKMASDAFDTTLALQGRGLTAENDDFGDSTNSQLSVFLEPGTYQLRAGALDEAARGAYSLDVEERKLPTGVKFTNSGALQAGKTITGLVSMSPATYSIELKQAARVQLEMRSSELDALLALSGNGVEYTDDDGAGNTDARLSALLLPGRYKIEAKSINDQSGVFELSYVQFPVSEARLTSIRPGQYAQGSHTPSRPAQATIIIPEAGEYVIDLASANFDVLLELKGHGVEVQDDDSGGGTNARISQYLEAGEYQVKVSSVDESGGRFTLSVQGGN